MIEARSGPRSSVPLFSRFALAELIFRTRTRRSPQGASPIDHGNPEIGMNVHLARQADIGCDVPFGANRACSISV